MNVALVALFAGSLDASGKARPAVQLHAISVVLEPELPPELMIKPPRLAPAPLPKPEKPKVDRKPSTSAPTSSAEAAVVLADPSSGAAADADGVYLGPAPKADGVPLGLQGLLKTEDPCAQVRGRLKADCGRSWSQLASNGDLLIEPSIEEMQKLYPGFAPPRFGSCSKHMGCYSDYEGEWRSLNGTRSAGLKSPMASGPGGLGGIHDLVGRLPPPNPYHVDPGFGD